MKKLLLFGSLFLSSLSFAQLNVGLIAQYDFSGDALDASGNNYHGILNGSPTLVNDRNGNPLSAYSFDGIDDYIMIDGFPTNQTNYSICAWIRSNDDTQLDKTVAMQVGVRPTDGDSIVSFGFGTTGSTASLMARHRDGTGTNWNPNNGIALPEEWIYAVQTYDGDSVILYLNGVIVAFAEVNTSSPKADQFMIGAGRYQAQIGAYFFNGIIDDIRVYNRELTICEIEELYSAVNPCNVGIEELNQGEKELIKVVDLMGREVTPQKNKTLIYVYSDGTTERVFEFE
jgi:hypothetical protein